VPHLRVTDALQNFSAVESSAELKNKTSIRDPTKSYPQDGVVSLRLAVDIQ
jgi:hypothetical protein